MKFNLDLNSVKYIKILYQDAVGNPATAKVALKRVDNREILTCTKFEEGLEIPTPQEIILSIICNDGLYRTKTKLKSDENDEPYTFFILETPSGIEYQQNREYFRVAVKYDCTYSTSTYYETKQIKAQTYDISANGVSLIFPIHEISVNNANLCLKINDKEINTKLKFIRSEKCENGYKFSFMFSKISTSDQDYISQVCIKKQLEQRKYAIK